MPVRLHWSWPVVAGLILLAFWAQLRATDPDLSTGAVIGYATIGAAVFFGSVLVHELAHALMARRRGIEVRGITLYLFGGATEADASSRSPTDEFLIAIVGPATSMGVAVLLGVAGVALGPSDTTPGRLLAYLALLNLVLAGFNLVPGLPLDGGRVFRAVAWGATGDFERATRWATTAGVAVGYALIGLGLLSIWQGLIGGLWSIGIGWMISQSARENQRHEQLRTTFGGLTAGDVMSSPVSSIPARSSVAEAVRDHFAPRDLTVLPVVDAGGRPVGLLSAACIRKVPASEIWQTPVDRLALQNQPALMAGPSTPMLEVIDAMSSAAGPKARVLVVDRGRLVGIISPADVVRRHALRDLIDQTDHATRREATP